MGAPPWIKRRYRLLAVLALGAAVTFAAACGDDGASGTTTAPDVTGPTTTVTAPPATSPTVTAPPATSATAPEMAVGVYFSDASGALVREERAVPEGDPVTAALGELLAGPTGAGLSPALPPGTNVLGVADQGDVVTVDLSAEFEDNYPPGGAAAEFAVLAPLVRTVSEAAGGDRVAITVEGRVPSPTGSQFDWTQPFSPDDIGG
jgi:spore germination protein GerM